jgi:hypothetical protein
MDAGYRQQGQAYLDSLNANADGINLVLFNVDCGHHGAAGRMEQVDVKTADFRGYCHKGNKMMQAGQWLDFWKCDPDDIVIFTDADIVLQRPFTLEEIAWFNRLESFGAGINHSEGATLKDELPGVYCMDEALTVEKFPNFETRPIYNTGVLAAPRHLLEAVFGVYVELYPSLFECMNHYAAVQWLICYCVGGLVELMPETLHSHGHFGRKPGVECVDGIWKFNGETIAFAHKL